jgi:hypothetical protein
MQERAMGTAKNVFWIFLKTKTAASLRKTAALDHVKIVS